MKRIAYIATDSGVDGREPEKCLYAFWNETQLKEAHEKDAAKNWRRLTETIVDVETAQAQALAKLNGIDRLVLGLPTWPEKIQNVTTREANA